MKLYRGAGLASVEIKVLHVVHGMDCGDTEDKVISILKAGELDYTRTAEFRHQYVNYYGNAAKTVLDKIFDNIR